MSQRSRDRTAKEILILECVRCAKEVNINGIGCLILTIANLYYEGNVEKVRDKVNVTIKNNLDTDQYIAYLEAKSEGYQQLLNEITR